MVYSVLRSLGNRQLEVTVIFPSGKHRTLRSVTEYSEGDQQLLQGSFALLASGMFRKPLSQEQYQAIMEAS